MTWSQFVKHAIAIFTHIMQVGTPMDVDIQCASDPQGKEMCWAEPDVGGKETACIAVRFGKEMAMLCVDKPEGK